METPTHNNRHTIHHGGGFIIAPVTGGYDVVDEDGETVAWRLDFADAMAMADRLTDEAEA